MEESVLGTAEKISAHTDGIKTFRLLALAALLAVVCSRSFVQRIERHRQHPQKGLRGGPRAGRLLSHGRPNSRLSRGYQPLIDNYDNFYLGNVTIGTTGQVFTLVMDTGSSNLWKCYNPQASSTYAPNGKRFHIQYGEGDVTGYLGADVVNFVDELVDLNQTFAIATAVSDDFAYQPVDGIFGLAWPSISDDHVPPPLFQILSKLDKPLFTIYLERHIKPSTNVPGGFITYGALDTEHCDAQIDYVPLTNEAWWEFNWDGFSVGKSHFPGQQPVISDSGTSYVYLLTPHYNAFITEIGAQFKELYGLWTVACDATIPDIVLTIGGKNYNIPPSEYVLDLGVGGGQCVLAVADSRQYTSPFGQPAIILGDVVLRAYWPA